ncbi:MAG: tRNA (adenosine(37)-N6)-threonylcarbamoyltransferase complex ATPase subunit type 1 TsaE [Chryseolinea sp.]
MTNESLVFREVRLPELRDVADEVARRVSEYPVWLFFGSMGAGKTTLIKEIGERLGVRDMITSPTFSIINEYERQDNSSIYHFDFYRIKDEMEAYDIGADEYLYSGYPCFIEWPERIPSLIPPRYGKIKIDTHSNTERTIVISLHDGKKENGI